MESLLLEYQDYGEKTLAPSFQLLYEQLSKKESTDRLLTSLLQHHGNNMQAVVDAVKAHKATQTGSDSVVKGQDEPSDKPVADQTSGLSAVKQAMQEFPKLAQKAEVLVDNPESFIKRKAAEINSKIDQKIESTSKFAQYKGQLKDSINRLAALTKKHPKKTTWVVAGLGIIGGLVTAGGPWIGGAITAILKMILMLIQGRPFGEAVKETLKSASISILLGFGIASAFTGLSSLFNAAEAAAPTGGSDPDAPGTGSTPSMIDAQPVASTPYIDRLRELVDPTGEGVGIPTINQDTFAKAFKAAREAMGPGNVFVWNGNVYTTNTEQEGLLRGLNNQAKRFIRGIN
jgi:ElaB/YqjD/DUF883 family membrane-anchored ribosome-binding protein